ncbi:MAG TPA: M48 family metalloprotease [Terriglobales bacterium]|nr:M48 family metalloprotease [Terriglobales bacterium]
MSSFKCFSLVFAIVVTCAVWSLAQDAVTPPQAPQITQPAKAEPADLRVQPSPAPLPPATFDAVIDRVVEREHFFVAQMRHLHPLVETYIQNTKKDKELGEVPASDRYFLGRLDMSNGTADDSFMGQPGFGTRFLSRLTSLYSLRFLPLGFAQMVLLDSDFQRKYYDFHFVRREFLGEVRCLVIDVHPREHVGQGRFLGRIWVEDQDYNIVRLNGTYAPRPKYSYYLHFDSWRLNMRPGIWLPAYIYSQETDLKYRGAQTLHFKAQTRLWGYDLQRLLRNDEFTQILVDEPQSVRDQSEAAQDASPLQAQRHWERQAEENAMERLQKVGLLAPPGEVDKVLQTVVNNLEVTNNLDVQPEVRCRVLLTSPLESFTIGHTIVISRGMLDVLPDEASLAMVLAHELGHIVLGHEIDTKFAFNDKLFFPDDETFQRLGFRHSPSEEDAADKKGLTFLENSPYKDKLSNAGLFLRALQDRAPDLKSLIRPHLGDGLGSKNNVRMAELLSSAPQLDVRRPDQIAALPLGGRVKLDPWSNKIELLKTKPVALTSPREKMPFEVTPFYPYLTRLQANPMPEKASLNPADK